MLFTITTLLLIEEPVFFKNWKIFEVVGFLCVGCEGLPLWALGMEILNMEMLGLRDLEVLVLRLAVDMLLKVGVLARG